MGPFPCQAERNAGSAGAMTSSAASPIPTLQLSAGDPIPMLGLGTWKLAAGSVAPAVEQALQLGYRHIDCAPIYGN